MTSESPSTLLFHCKIGERSPQVSNLPGRNTPLTLPPEILDKILDHVPTNKEGRRTLTSSALVATWWTGPSQRRLFSSVEIYGNNYDRWMNGVVLSGSKTHLLKYVRSLWHFCGLYYRMRELLVDSGDYFSALRNLHSLAFCNIWLEHLSEEESRICFSAFRETLTDLTLMTFGATFSGFVALVNYFPNITTLRLDSFVLEPDESPVPPLSRPLRGKLCVFDVQPGDLEFFNRFFQLSLEYEELVIDDSLSVFTETILQMSPSTIKFLRLTVELPCE